MKPSVSSYFRIQCEGPCNNKRIFTTVKSFLVDNLNCNSGNKILLQGIGNIVIEATVIT